MCGPTFCNGPCKACERRMQASSRKARERTQRQIDRMMRTPGSAR